MEAFYYLADRYAFDEVEVSFEEVRPTLERLVDMHVQDFVSQLFAEKEGGKRMYYFTPDQEIDFIITVRGRPRLVGEVKLGKVGDRDLRRFEETASIFPDTEKVLVCGTKVDWPGITVLTPEKLVV
jgi:hypothetical protein